MLFEFKILGCSGDETKRGVAWNFHMPGKWYNSSDDSQGIQDLKLHIKI